MSNFICRAPWVSLAFQPKGLAPCCIFDLKHLQQNNKNIHQSMQPLREQFLSGQVPEGCQKCHQNHMNGFPTYARSFDRYPTDFKEPQIQEINIKANNFCNLKCRSCGPHFSSKWEEEIDQVFHITKDTDIPDKLAQVDYSKLVCIVFAGGEPTIQSEHVQVLTHLVNQNLTHIKIRIATNLHSLKFKDTNLLDLWKNFPNLELQVSVDAVGEQAESVRSGTKWQILSDNITQLINSGINFYVNITVSALNIWFLKTTVDQLKSLGVSDIQFNWLSAPDILDLTVIPEQYTDQLKSILTTMQSSSPELSIGIRKLNSSNQHLWSHFLIYNLLLDQARDEKLIPSLPILKDLKQRWITDVL
jgi:sulfatase maturation enzyme AslB (radical SAM superfamily)